MFFSRKFRRTPAPKTVCTVFGAPLGMLSLDDRITPSFGGWADWVDYVAPAAATHFIVLTPETTQVGKAAPVEVIALDASNHRVPNYTGTVSLSSSDTGATLPDKYTFTADDHGIHVFTETASAIGSQTLTATDASDATITGSATEKVTDKVASATVTHVAVISQRQTDAGETARFVVVALDASNRPVRDYTGTVHLTSTDGKATLPADYTFSAGDRGSHIFKATFATTGTQTVTATDTATAEIAGSASLEVNAAAVVTHFALISQRSTYAGSPTAVAVVPLDASNRPVASFTGTVTFTSSDASATLPADYTFTADDAGFHRFDVTLATTGTDTISVADTATKALTGSASVAVTTPLVATHLAVYAAPDAYVGAAVKITIAAQDDSDRRVSTYTGTVHFTSTDAKATLPADYTFTAADHGRHTYTVTLASEGSQTVTATDIGKPAFTATASVAVSAAPVATKFAVLTAPWAFVGESSRIIVVALDANGRPVSNYAGTVTVRSTDTAAILPAKYTFTTDDYGAHVFRVTPGVTGTETLTVSDADTSSIVGTVTLRVRNASTGAFGFGGGHFRW